MQRELKAVFTYLFQIGNTKTNDNQQTLMHFLAMTAEKHYPDVMDFADELLHVEKATKGTSHGINCRKMMCLTL